jgi:hypothetical protein
MKSREGASPVCADFYGRFDEPNRSLSINLDLHLIKMIAHNYQLSILPSSLVVIQRALFLQSTGWINLMISPPLLSWFGKWWELSLYV